MISFRKFFSPPLTLIFVFALTLHAKAGQISVSAAIDPPTVYLGDAAALRITIDGATTTPSADIPAIDGVSIASNGVSQSSSQHVTIINGQMSQETKTTFTMNYSLRPARGGTFEIPAIPVTADGQTVQTQPLTLRAVSPSQDDLAKIEVVTQPDQVSIGQEFKIILKIYLRRLVFDNRVVDVEPFQQRNPPALAIPWFESLPNTETKDFQSFASGLVGSPGFTINNYQQNDFFNRRLISFRPQRAETVIRGTAYYVYTIEKTFKAIKAGTVEIAPSSIKGSVFDQIVAPDQATQRAVFQVSNALTMKITDPPESGRPAEWNGAIGQYKISAAADPVRLNLGDPITLTVTVRGAGLWNTVDAPDLSKQSEFERGFRIHDRDVPGEMSGDAKIFRYTIRPVSPDVRAVPPVRFSFFDPGRRSYVSVRSDAIPLEIRSTGKVNLEEIIEAEGRPVKTELKEMVEGLFENETSEDRVFARQQPGFSPAIASGFFAAPSIFFVLGIVSVALSRRDVGARRASGAAAAFRKTMATLPRDRDAQNISKILSALGEFTRDRLRIESSALTGSEIIHAWKSHNLAPDLSVRLEHVVASLERAQFGGAESAPAGENLRTELTELVRHLDRAASR